MRPFEIPAIGVDISDESFKFVNLIAPKGERRINFFGERDLERGLIKSGEIKNPDEVAKALRSAFLPYQKKIPYLMLSLPEEKGFVRIIKLEHVKKDEVRSAVEFQLEEHIPFPPEQLTFDYEILDEKEDIDVLVTAYPRDVVESYVEIVKKSGFIPTIFELESQAIARAVVPTGFKGACLVGDIGRTRTTFFIVRNGFVYFTSTIRTGGHDIDNILMQSLHLSIEEATDVKVGRGYDYSAEEIIKSLSPVLVTLKEEAERQINFWEHRYMRPEDKISKIYLCGGDANLKGLPEFLTLGLSMPAERARVWENIYNLKRYIPTMSAHDTLRYATAFGLAMRSGTGLNGVL